MVGPISFLGRGVSTLTHQACPASLLWHRLAFACLVLVVHVVNPPPCTSLFCPSSPSREAFGTVQSWTCFAHKRPVSHRSVQHSMPTPRRLENRITFPPSYPFDAKSFSPYSATHRLLHFSPRFIWPSQPASGGPSPADSVPHRLPQKRQRGASGRRHAGRDRVPKGDGFSPAKSIALRKKKSRPWPVV